MKYSTKYVATMALLFQADAFTPQAMSNQRSSSALNLLPGQGNQLVAAYNAANFKANDDDEQYVVDVEDFPTTTAAVAGEELAEATSSTAARSFVKRVFSLPSNLISHPHPIEEGLFSFKKTSTPKEDDVVLYPVVGFQFVKDKERYIPLPTSSTTRAACRIVRNQNEDVFGWYTPHCKLDVFSEDLCHKPEEEANENLSA